MIFNLAAEWFYWLSIKQNESCTIFYYFSPLYITFPTNALGMIWMIHKYTFWKYFPLMLKKELSVGPMHTTFFPLNFKCSGTLSSARGQSSAFAFVFAIDTELLKTSMEFIF